MTDTPIQILLVEDNATDALLLEHELKDSSFGSFSMRRAVNLEEAFDQLQEHRFDVVLLDLGLSDSEGVATLERLVERNPRNIPIVVLTGMDDQLLGIRALQEGAEDYLVKNGSRDSMRAIRYAIERKRADEAFRATEEKLSMAVQAAELGLFDWNVTSGTITGSLQYARLLGLGAEEFKGTFDALMRCVHSDDRAAMSAALDRSLATRGEYRHEYRVVWPDGSEHWLEGRGKVINDEHGMPLRLTGTVMDISHRKSVEEAARVRETELARLDRAKLTPRELTLLKMIATGLSNKRIAIDLDISIRTVAKHRSHLMAKTQALNAADLARMSTVAGLSAGFPQLSEQAATATSSSTILIGDDDLGLIRLLRTILEPLGVNIHETHDATSALAFVQRAPPAVAILDINMPGGNGLSACEMMKTDKKTAQVPVIIFSGTSDDVTRRRCAEMGAHFACKSDPEVLSEIEQHVTTLLSVNR
jgi:PAS domain S-box-containing protein